MWGTFYYVQLSQSERQTITLNLSFEIVSGEKTSDWCISISTDDRHSFLCIILLCRNTDHTYRTELLWATLCVNRSVKKKASMTSSPKHHVHCHFLNLFSFVIFVLGCNKVQINVNICYQCMEPPNGQRDKKLFWGHVLLTTLLTKCYCVQTIYNSFIRFDSFLHTYNTTTHYDHNNKHKVELLPFWQCQQKLKNYKLSKSRIHGRAVVLDHIRLYRYT